MLPFVLSCLFAADPGWPDTVVPEAKLVELYSADSFFEGPVWHPASGKLYFTWHKGKTNQVMRLDEPGQASVWMKDSEGIGSMIQGPNGRLFATQAYGHRLLDFAVGADGPTDTKVLHHQPQWHQPNDLARTPRGDLYFTDPDFANKKTSAVYRWSPDAAEKGTVTKVADDLAVPNGIVASLDGKTLYVSDSFRKHWRSYPIRDDGTLGPGRVFFEPDTDHKSDPDGMAIDENGNLYCSGRGGLWVVAPDGRPRGFVKTPVFISNVELGGPDERTLFLVGSGKVYSLALTVRCPPYARR